MSFQDTLRYHVSYYYKKGNEFGHGRVMATKKITKTQDLADLEKLIKENNNMDSVIILNYHDKPLSISED